MSVVMTPEEQLKQKKLAENRAALERLKNLASTGTLDPTRGQLEAKRLYSEFQGGGDQATLNDIAGLGQTFRKQGSVLDPNNTMAYEQANTIYQQALGLANKLPGAGGTQLPGTPGSSTLAGIYGLIQQGGPTIQPLLDLITKAGGQDSGKTGTPGQDSGQPGTPGQGATQTTSTSSTTTAGIGDLSAQIRSMEPQELTQVISFFQGTIDDLKAKEKDLIARAATQKTEIDPDTQASIDRLRESMEEGIKAAKEEANRRGILDSGIALALTQKPRTEFQRGQTYLEGSRLKAIKDRLDQQLAALDSRIYQTQMAKASGLMSTRQNLLNLYSNAALTEQGRAQQQGQFNEQMTYQKGRDQVTDAKGLIDFLVQMGQNASAKEQQAFQNEVAKAGITGTYEGQPTLQKQTAEAGLTGTYQGKPTMAKSIADANAAAKQTRAAGQSQSEEELADAITQLYEYADTEDANRSTAFRSARDAYRSGDISAKTYKSLLAEINFLFGKGNIAP